MAGEGETGDLFRKREEAFAISTYNSNREDLIRFYQDLARMGKEKIPADMKAADASDESVSGIRKGLDDALRQFTASAAKMSRDGASTAVARLCLAMFFHERVKKLREISLRLDRLGTYSLYVTLRNRISRMLSPAFFAGSSQDLAGAWLDVEPLLTACSGLCGLEVPDLRGVMDEYQPRVADAVAVAKPGK